MTESQLLNICDQTACHSRWLIYSYIMPSIILRRMNAQFRISLCCSFISLFSRFFIGNHLSFTIPLLMTLIRNLPSHNSFIQSMQECTHDVKLWLTHNRLKLNDNKTEVLILSAPRISNSTSFPDSLVVGNLTVHFYQSVKTFGVHLMCIWYVVNLIWTAIFELCHISSLHYYLCVQATQTPVFAFILLWLTSDWLHLESC